MAMGLKGERYAKDGIEYYQRGDYAKALEMYKLADKAADGAKTEYFYWLGRIYTAMQDNTNAIVWFTKYLESNDGKHQEQAEIYVEILTHTNEIFEKISMRQLPGYMNSRNSDYGVLVSPDGDFLYLNSLRPSRYDKENIWRAERLNNLWGRPFPVDELNTDKNEAAGSFSLDGKTMYLSGNYERGKIDGDIYSSNFVNGKWQTPGNLSNVNSSQVDVHPYVFEDKWMFFTSSREGGYGGTDIYVSEFTNNEWQLPVNLGSMINSSGNEQTPFLYWDGKTLFFASDGHPGFGGFDLFKAVKIGNKWTDWSIPENLGMPINSTKNERHYFHAKDSDEVFFSSDRFSEGFENMLALSVIYAPRTYQIYDIDGKKRTIRDEEEIDVPKPEPQIIVFQGNISDDAGNYIVTEIQFDYTLDKIRHQEFTQSDENGNFNITLPLTEKYSVTVNLEDYFLYSMDLLPSDAEQPLLILLQKMEDEKVFVFNNIQFDFDKATLKKESFPILNEIVLTLLNNPKIDIEISGHTCNMGKAAYNQKLSELRAAAVVKYILDKGVEKKRLESKGFGLSKPVADNNTKTGRQKNRRVEVKVLR
jgi:outer membrane protein OmpA-like peptidoglycan-associated protein